MEAYIKSLLSIGIIGIFFYLVLACTFIGLNQAEWRDLTKEFPPKDIQLQNPVLVQVDENLGIYYVGGYYVDSSPISLEKYINKRIVVKAKIGGFREILTRPGFKRIVYEKGVMALKIENMQISK